METKYGFTRMSIAEFEAWLPAQSVSRTVTKIQEHHTWSPSYAQFSGNNHLEMQRGMRDHHVNHNGWSDIGQHFSIFPDGDIVTGRPLNGTPACIFGNNAQSVCIENVGNFDAGKDAMTAAQRNSIVRATAVLARKFNRNPVTTNNIVYHHWFDLNSGERTNGSGSAKSCPGTAFFGGNRVQDCQANFLPLVQAILDGAGPAPAPPASDFAAVTAESLNIRAGAGSGFAVVDGQGALERGSVVRIYSQQDGWLKISSSKEYWVFGKWVRPVARKLVDTDASNGRAGPGTDFPIVKTFNIGDEVFVHSEANGWSRIGIDPIWIRSSLLG